MMNSKETFQLRDFFMQLTCFHLSVGFLGVFAPEASSKLKLILKREEHSKAGDFIISLQPHTEKTNLLRI
jgi:hypothetical protein